MEIYNSNGTHIKLGQSIGRGGEAVVYQVLGKPSQLAKIYTGHIRPDYHRKLAWMLNNSPEDPTLASGHASLAWPQDLLYDVQGQLLGYLMAYIQGSVPLIEVFNPKRRAQILPKFDRRYQHRAARNLAAALGALHASDYIVGDLNESNILVKPSALVTLIDTDSFQVQEKKWRRRVTYPCPVARIEYTPPELQGRPLKGIVRGIEHDAFSLGVLIYQLLMDGNHPFRAHWSGIGDPPPIEERIQQGCFPYKDPPGCPISPPKNAPRLDILHPNLVELVMQCFVDGHRNPKRRPMPGTWLQALGEAEDSLVLCRKGHYYSNHLEVCPQCTPPPTMRIGTLSPVSSEGAALKIPKRPVTFIPALLFKVSAWLPPWWKVQQGWRINGGRILRRVASAGVRGALSGALAGALTGLVAWMFGKAVGWGFILALGGAFAGLSLSWKLGLGLGESINKQIGWLRFWQITGVVSGASGVGYLTWLLGNNIVLTVAAALLGGMGGGLAGMRVWRLGRQVSWNLIAMGVATLVGMWAGWNFGYFVGETWLGVVSGELTSQLILWMVNKSMTWQMAWIWVGTAGGGLGGGLAGIGYGITISLLRMNN